MIRFKTILSAAITLMLLGSLSIAFAAPKPDLWERWAAHDPDSTAEIDHGVWDKLLKRSIVSKPQAVSRFYYANFRGPNKRMLEGYLQEMSGVTISRFNRDQQRAYWINLYNALTVYVVAENFPVDSIKDITSGFFTPGPWDRELIEVEGERLTLNDIEHRILRPIWQDPRLHYAINCASIGCPNIQTDAYTAANSEKLLELGAGEYINHPRGASVSNGKLRVSSIYVWFNEDFGGSETGVITHLKKYAEGDLKKALNGIDEIDNHGYDWKINSVRNPEIQRSNRRTGS